LIKNNPPKNNINFESTGPFSIKDDTINKLLNSSDSNKEQPKQSALSDLWKSDKNSDNVKKKDDNKFSFDFSDEEKSHSITDLYNQFTNINNNKAEKLQQPAKSNASMNDHESSVEFLIKNNLIPSPPLNSTAREIGNLEIMPAANNDNNKPSIISNKLGGIFKDQDNFDQSESLDDLEDMFNKAKEGSNKPKETDIERPSGLLIKNNPPAEFQTKVYLSFFFTKSFSSIYTNLIKDSPKNEILASLLNKEKPKPSSANPTLSNLLNNNKSKPNSIEDNYIKSIKNSIEYSNNDFESDDDEIEDLVNPKLSKSGTIGAAIGAVVVGNSGLTGSTSSIKSIPNFNSKDKQYPSSFTSIIPELFDSNNNDNSNFKSPKKPVSDQNDSAMTELVNKLRLKNNELEKDKLELESKLRELDMEKKKFEMLFNHSDKELAEKEKLIDKMNEEKLKSEYAMKSELNELKILRKEINDLKEDKHALENKLSLYQAATTLTATTSANQSTRSTDENNNTSTLANLNESLNIKIKALENQIEELNKDRKILSACKEDLSIKLEETENDISKRNEALELATYKFNLEKKALTEENIKLKKDYNELNETRKKLQHEIDNLKLELNEKYFNYEKLNLEKSNYENQFNREKEDNEKVRKNYDSELIQLKDQQLKLTEKLSSAEAKLISTERDLKYTQNQIDEKEKQITSLRDELVKSKSDYSLQLNLLKLEKEEKENLIRKCETLEASLKKNNEEYNNKSSKLNRSSKLDVDEDEKNTRDLTELEKENSDLNKEVKNLIEKLKKTEYEFEKFKTEAELNELKSAIKSNNSPSNKEVIINSENERLKNEVQKLRNDFNQMLNKYSNLEDNIINNNSNQNTLNGNSTLPKGHITSYDNRNKNDFLIRQNPVDVPA
jgi:chromosome segregation ATPase